jgi:hypothetical protein
MATREKFVGTFPLKTFSSFSLSHCKNGWRQEREKFICWNFTTENMEMKVLTQVIGNILIFFCRTG